ncbi:AAA family ATPase [Agromyces sp. Root1464]|uniref:AAA family ATPase n=1 Tax=Agromyces sp. Root1464 TaxID=1736467 RepID=UPI001F16FCBE|nr:AAA family ATPase [Agromyces sp. Root1464]
MASETVPPIEGAAALAGGPDDTASVMTPDPPGVPTAPSAQQAVASSGGRAIDWDAATAAALSADPDPAGIVPDHHPTGPDRLLEDLIREIVGDATADTASSLHPARAQADGGTTVQSVTVQNQVVQTTTAETPTAVPSADTAAETEPETRETAAMAETQAVATDAVVARSASPGIAPAEATPGSVPLSSGPTHEIDSPESTIPLAPVAARPMPEVGDGTEERISAAVLQPSTRPPEAPATAGPGPAPLQRPDSEAVSSAPRPVTTTPPGDDASISPAPQSAPAAGPHAPTEAPDVSRETSSDHGGTPLAYELADETRRRTALDEAVLPLPPSTRVLTISNQKGGVGKTTTAVNLAAGLARSGARVLVIDLDPQGNASTALGVDHRSERKSVYEVLVSDVSLAEVVQPSTEHELLDCVPATIHLAGAEIELVSLVAREQRLRRALDAHLASMDRPYDYVFIDCPPSLGLLTINAFVAAREVLIPIQCEYYALEGLSQLLSNIELIEKHLNPELRLSTILLTMYDSRTNLAQQVAQEVRDHFPAQTLETIIPRSVRVSEAPSYGQSVISYDFGSTGSLSYREAAAEIARRGAATPEESN